MCVCMCISELATAVTYLYHKLGVFNGFQEEDTKQDRLLAQSL